MALSALSFPLFDQLDVRSSCVEHIPAEHGRIDVVVNNAGYGSYGALEDVPCRGPLPVRGRRLRRARLTQLVLPYTREQGSGTILNITSMGGKIYTRLGAWYHATRFALEALSESLRMEVRPFGINVVVIEPGGINNKLPANQAHSGNSRPGSHPGGRGSSPPSSTPRTPAMVAVPAFERSRFLTPLLTCRAALPVSPPRSENRGRG